MDRSTKGKFMSRHYQDYFIQLLSSLCCSLLVLSYLPARAYNHDPGKQPATEACSRQSGRAVSQPTPYRNSGFLSAPAAGDPLPIALDYLRAHKFELGLTGTRSGRNCGERSLSARQRYVTHLYLRQRLDGIELFNGGGININIMPDGALLFSLGGVASSAIEQQGKDSRPRWMPLLHCVPLPGSEATDYQRTLRCHSTSSWHRPGNTGQQRRHLRRPHPHAPDLRSRLKEWQGKTFVEHGDPTTPAAAIGSTSAPMPLPARSPARVNWTSDAAAGGMNQLPNHQPLCQPMPPAQDRSEIDSIWKSSIAL